MKRYEIKEQDLKAIITYLKKRPYEEVYQGINMLVNLKEVKEDGVQENRE